MRAPALAVWFAVLAGMPAACRRPPLCPAGEEETRVSGDAVWCKDPKTSARAYLLLHPGTRQVRQRCSFAGGALEGPFVATHPGGKPFLEGSYQGGKLAGRWIQWDAGGKKVAEGEYREGRLVSGAPVAVGSTCESVPVLQ